MSYSCLFHTCWVCNSTVLALCTFGLRCCLELRGGRAASRKQSLFSKRPAGLSITLAGLAADAEPAAVTSALLPAGTSSGAMACWDMRFQLPISSHCHPARARVRRLSMHPLYQSWVIAGRRRAGRAEGPAAHIHHLRSFILPVSQCWFLWSALILWKFLPCTSHGHFSFIAFHEVSSVTPPLSIPVHHRFLPIVFFLLCSLFFC